MTATETKDDTMSGARIIDGKAFAAGLRERIACEVGKLKATHGIKPGLAVVLVGDDPASQVYVRNKGKATIKAGMESFEHRLPESTTQEELMGLVQQLNADPAVHGILVQLPLPGHLNPVPVIDAIDPLKDVDGLNIINAGLLADGQRGMVPCTPLGCVMLIKDALGGQLSGKNALVIGRSNLVGKPIAQLLLGENCTVTIAHSRTADLPGECQRADILVAAVGRPEMVRGDWIKPGAVVIDVGINRIDGEEGTSKLVGDVNFAEAVNVAGAITPVPGGVGPMTIACLLANTLTAACRQHKIDPPDLMG